MKGGLPQRTLPSFHRLIVSSTKEKGRLLGGLFGLRCGVGSSAGELGNCVLAEAGVTKVRSLRIEQSMDRSE